MSSRIKYFVVSSSTCLTLLLLLGWGVGRGASQDDTLKHIGVFSEVVGYIEKQYVEEPDMKSVTMGALDGMLEAIDPFASYLSADQYRDYLKTKDLKRADVGLVLSKRYGTIVVVDAAAGSPAAKAGFTTGDMIESIKGVATRDMPLAFANMMLQGDAGSEIELSVVRVRRPEPQTVKLIRATYAAPPVETKVLGDGVGYITVSSLSSGHLKETADAIKQLQKNGAKKFVIDLRSCGVGTPEDGIAFANLFMKSGRITYLKGQRVPQQNFDADPAKDITDLPVAVLVNHGTADGAEVAAAALLGNKRGQVVGERTYGDAGQRKALTMDDGSAIILSVAKYYSPDGKAIQDTGVTPGTLVADAEPAVEYDENENVVPQVTPEKTGPKKIEDDPVVKKALEILG
ncbi:MAG: S41 family peptidase [Bryobacteraceae bacterium]